LAFSWSTCGVRAALLCNAHAVFLAHTHPSDDSEPGNGYKRVTELLVKAGNLMEVQVLDHVILGNTGSYFSFREKNINE